MKWLILTTLFAIANAQFGLPNLGKAASQGLNTASSAAKNVQNAAQKLVEADWKDFGVCCLLEPFN